MFIGHMTPTHTQTTAVAAGVQLFPAGDPARVKYRLVQNTDAAKRMWIALGVAAQANKGIIIPAGGSYEMSREKGNLFVGVVNGATEGADEVVALMTEGC